MIKPKTFCYVKDQLHWLDHLCPLAHFLDIPIIVNDKSFLTHIEHFYPQVTSVFVPLKDFTMEFITQNIDVLISSSQSSLFIMRHVTKSLYQKKTHYIYLPHGNSDKGFSKNYIDYLKDQDMSFYYGEHMLNQLKERSILNTLKGVIRTGNFRKKYFHKFQTFYDRLSDQSIFSFFPKKQPTVLYSPTWNDLENFGSFEKIAASLLKNLPDHYNLILKLHPFLEESDPAKTYCLTFPFEKFSNVTIVRNYHCIYSVLAKTDIYLGDFSSIGYDALSFDIPLFFINTSERTAQNDKGFHLYQTGMEIPKNFHTKIFNFIDNSYKNNKYNFQQQRRNMYHYCFGKDLSTQEIQSSFSHAMNLL